MRCPRCNRPTARLTEGECPRCYRRFNKALEDYYRHDAEAVERLVRAIFGQTEEDN